MLDKLESYIKLSGKSGENRHDELFNVVIWDQEKFNKASIQDVQREFRKEMLITEINENEDDYFDKKKPRETRSYENTE